MPPLDFRIATNSNRGGWSEEVGLVPEEVGLSNRNKKRRPCQEAVIGGDQSRRRNLLCQEKTGGRDNSDPPCDRQGAVTTVRQGAVTTVILLVIRHASIVSALSHASTTEPRLYRVCVGRRRCPDAFPSHASDLAHDRPPSFRSARRNRSGPEASAPRDGGAGGCLRRRRRLLSASRSPSLAASSTGGGSARQCCYSTESTPGVDRASRMRRVGASALLLPVRTGACPLWMARTVGRMQANAAPLQLMQHHCS
jgi:hypothetical protein